MQKLFTLLRESAANTLTVCGILFKLIIPISIIMKIIKELGWISYIGDFLAPVMGVVGLPGSYGLVWATAMCTNIYGAMLVFSGIITSQPLTTAQVTVLGIMILVAHGLPVESSVARKSGIRLRVSLVIRIGMAIAFGFIFYRVFNLFNLYNTEPVILWVPENNAPGIAGWAAGELKNYAVMVVIIFSLITGMKLLEKSGFIGILVKILHPLLKILGIGEKAIPITIIGIVLGYAYGGGLIIQEAKSGRITKKDLFYTIIFLSLCHSFIEDSLLMVSIGSAALPVFLGRFILSYITCSVIVLLTRNMDYSLFIRLFFRPESGKSPNQAASEN
ncbi:MAG: hypothetical protein RBT69_11425 [Spirochaetia bacterium]|jgi:hypothetical protein|nr:hypothetical protein [Spirochaetia bacterium]